MRGKVILQKFITRNDLRENPDRLYMFGDNMERSGYGGQAREMRGEPNALGVPTKRRPSMAEGSFFCDDDIYDQEICQAIIDSFQQAIAHIVAGKDVVLPEDGLGTGMAQLSTRAPRIAEMIALFTQALWMTGVTKSDSSD